MDQRVKSNLLKFATVAVATTLLVGACGGSSGLKLTRIDSSVQKPSNIAVYFTVDTSDGDPVPGLEADSFRIYEDGTLVSVHESKQTILNPEVAAEHYTLLLVDMSGSVIESGDVPAIVDAATAFADRVGKYQRVAVYAFDGRKEIVKISEFSNNAGTVKNSIERLNSFKSRDPSTNLNGAVIAGLREIDRQLSRASAPLRFGTIVVFTDGTDRAARVPRDELHDFLDETEVEVMVIGVGAEIDEDELSDIGRGGLIMTKKRSEISDAFEQAAAHIEAASRRFYLLGYCSPARAGVHEVRIEADFEGKKGSLEYEYDAKGFLPNCNPEKKPAFDVRRPKIPDSKR